MKALIKSGIGALILSVVLAAGAIAGEFHSRIITSSPLVLKVPEHHFLRIWTFTQDGGTQRGVVAVSTNTETANVLTATLINSTASATSSSLEPVNQVVIAGPVRITVAPVAGATLFLTYRKENEGEPGPTPTATPIPTATVTPTATPTPTPTP